MTGLLSKALHQTLCGITINQLDAQQDTIEY